MKKVKLDNPFAVFGYSGPEYFCDREQETDKLVTALHNGWNVSMISPRRLGKTGLILHTFDKLEGSGISCFYIDIYSTKNLTEFVEKLANAIVGKLDTPFEKAVKKVSELFSAFRPTMSIDSRTGDPSFSFDILPRQAKASLETTFEYVKQSGKKCIIAIDEFQQILNYPETGTEAMLRSIIQFLPTVRFVFAGSRLHMMQEMFLSPSHPFFRSTQVMELHEIAENKYLVFANHFFKEQNREMSADDFHKLYSAVDGQTFYVQAILNKIYSHPSSPIDAQLVHDCLWEAIEEQIGAFQFVYGALSENLAMVLKAVAKEGNVEEPTGKDFLEKNKLPSKSSVKSAIDSLVKKQLLYKDSNRGYIVYDRFMGIWLATL